MININIFKVLFVYTLYFAAISIFTSSCSGLRDERMQKERISLEILETIRESIKSYNLENNKNPKKLTDLEPHFYRSATGKIEDAWGVLIFYDQNKNELRSAGLDRKLWTQDDLVVNF